MGEPLIIDGCAGAGGWSEALSRLGRTSVGIDNFVPACVTATNAGHARILADVATFPLDHLAGTVEGMCWSPPCQGFSKAGRRLGLADVRSQLVWEPLRWAEALRPCWLCCEQVPEVLVIWRMEAERLRSLGYRTWCGLLDAADYGTPQNRTRAILIASLDHQPTGPPPTHCEGGREGSEGLFGSVAPLAPWTTMAEALGWDETWEVEYQRGAGMTERYGTRPTRRASRPSVTIKVGSKGSGAALLLHTGANSMVTGRVGSRAGDGDVQPYERDTDRLAPTVDTKAGTAWRLSTPGRSYDAPRRLSAIDRPAPTVAVGHDQTSWEWHRPATTVQGDTRIALPGHHDRQMNDAVKVTIPELGVLQDFPADSPGAATRASRQPVSATPSPSVWLGPCSPRRCARRSAKRIDRPTPALPLRLAPRPQGAFADLSPLRRADWASTPVAIVAIVELLDVGAHVLAGGEGLEPEVVEGDAERCPDGGSQQ